MVSKSSWYLTDAAIDPDLQDKDYPDMGFTWAEPADDARPKEKRKVKTLFCQEGTCGEAFTTEALSESRTYIRRTISEACCFSP